MALRLHDVDDAARFVGAIVTRSGLELSYHDREDLEQHLAIECWQLSVRFRPGGISFSTYAGTVLRKRVIDWQRKTGGRRVWKFKNRTYIRPKVELVSLDSDDSLGAALASRAGDPADGGGPACGGLLAHGGRTRARDLDLLGLEAPARATR